MNKDNQQYSFLRDTINGSTISISSFRAQDLSLIKQWRNEQMDILRQKNILTDKDQEQYYQNCISPTFNKEKPNQIFVSIVQNKECIGYGALVYVDWEHSRAEVSFLLKTEITKDQNRYMSLFSEYLSLIKNLSFKRLGINRLYTETFEFRPKHIETLEHSGFNLEGRLREHVIINNHPTDSLIHGCLKKDYRP